MLEKELCVDKICVNQYGDLELIESTVIKENGVELSRANAQRVILFDADVSQENARIQQLHAAAQLNAKVKPVIEP